MIDACSSHARVMLEPCSSHARFEEMLGVRSRPLAFTRGARKSLENGIIADARGEGPALECLSRNASCRG